MQKTIRFNENQLLYLAAKAKRENTIAGNLHKKSSDTGKWQQRYFILYQNLLFYFENESSARPSGVALLEGSYCDRVVTPAALKSGKDTEKQYCFTITYKSEGQRQYDLRTETESECNAWIDHVKRAPYSKVLEQKEELEQKHLHLLQILDSERQAKWHYVQQTEELATDVKKLRGEVMLNKYKKDRITTVDSQEEETDELKKIKKVQSFFRGWLCRRRWKQIVELYIRSPHAESMRKRNSIVFNMVECEEEYNRQLSTLVTCFLRPLRMAASSKKPPITHEDVNSIFLNSETLLFLHQIFLKGLCARLENWPTLVLGDLFDMLLPMLCIYQEYVRNHHYSLQVLAEYKQKLEFNSLLKRYEEKPLCEGRTLEIFLTYPMHQIPRYIITLHELLAHTPHDHVERQSLEYAKSKLEELSRIMHDEVSETENIRKNLSIERMIVEGCDILLDVNQTFVRQGTLLQVFHEKGKSVRGRLGSFSSTFKESKKEVVRQIFLFTNHMLLTTRASNGRLHLAKILPKDRQHYGKIPLIDCTLIEDPNTEICFFDEETESLDNFSLLTNASGATLLPTQTYDSRDGTRPDYNGLDFKIIVDSKSGPPTVLTLVASTYQEKIAWCSDISQCIENLHYSDLLNTSMSESSSVTMPQSVRSDPKLFRDDVDIKFSRTLNSCKVPQIRHASVERLLDRLTDLRFLSIDFLNTFLLTYRVFTNGKTVLDALKRVYKNPECGNLETAQASGQSSSDMDIYGSSPPQFTEEPPSHSRLMIKPQAEKPRRISTGMMNLETTGTSKPAIQIISKEAPPTALRKTLLDDGSEKPQTRRVSFHKLERTESLEATPEVADTEDSRTLEMDTYLSPPGLAPIASQETLYDELTIPDLPSFTQDHPMHSPSGISLPIPTESSTDDFDSEYRTLKLVHEEDTISIPGMEKELEPPTLSPRPFGMYAFGSAASSETLTPGTPRVSPMPSPHISTRMIKSYYANGSPRSTSPRQLSSPSKNLLFNGGSESKMFEALALSPTSSPIRTRPIAIRVPSPRSASPSRQPLSPSRQPPSPIYGLQQPPSPLRRPSSPCRSPSSSPKFRRAHSPMSPSMSSPNILTPHTGIKMRQDISGKRGSASVEAESVVSSPRSSIVTQIEGSPPTSRVGAVVTSSRRSTRRSSSSSAMIAFAAATAGSADPLTSSQQTQTVPVVQPQVSVSAPQPESQQKQQQEQPAQPPHQPPKRYLSTGAVVITDPKLLKKRESVISTAATMRVLNIIKHWVSKHQQDFETDQELKTNVIDMLEEMVCNTSLVPAEHKVAASILRTITKESEDSKRVDLNKLLTPPEVSSMDNFDTLSALDIAEQLTYLDHKIFISIRSEELLGQAWMKPDKSHKAPHVLLVSKRFNEVSRLVVSEIVSRQNLQDRVACIEKWAAIADICRCMHNYNGVLQICAAFVNSSVYRLKKTWEKLSKQTKNMIEKLQVLVSSDGRFKNMRDALHRYGCDPPCIPYLGMYLTDLSFIEEGTPDFTDEGLVNFSKMRMIAHVIREIRLFQQTPYRIEHHCRTSNYLLDTRRLLDDDQTYKASLEIEPKQSRLSTVSLVPS